MSEKLKARLSLAIPESTLTFDAYAEAMDKNFAALQPHWLYPEDGTDCMCVIHAKRLKTAKL